MAPNVMILCEQYEHHRKFVIVSTIIHRIRLPYFTLFHIIIIWEWCHWKASYPIRTLRYCTYRPWRYRECNEFGVEQHAMDAQPPPNRIWPNQAYGTSSMVHRWRLLYSLAGSIQDAPPAGRSVGRSGPPRMSAMAWWNCTYNQSK